MWFKHKIKRLLVKLRRFKKNKTELIFDNSEQEHVFNVVDKLIRNLDSELLAAPIIDTLPRLKHVGFPSPC